MQSRNRDTDIKNGCVDMEGGMNQEFGTDIYTLPYLNWITNKDLLYSTGNSAQCYMTAWMGRESGGEWIHICVWLRYFAVHLKLSQHC